jgi:signal transduction histidine kinase
MAYRVLVGVWMTVVFLWEIWERTGNDPDGLKPDVSHPAVGLTLIAAAWVIIALVGVSYARDADAVLSPGLVLSEIAISAALLFADTWVYGSTHSQALPTVWPLAAIFTVAIAAGTRPALLTGLGLGLARYMGWLAFPYEADTRWSLARVASTVLFAVAGWVAGYLLTSQAAADRSISAYRAREEVARTLHDGVLQTLAVIQHRSHDTELVTLARTQELELRDYLFGGSDTAENLATALRATARRAEQRYPIRVDVICAPDLPAGNEQQIHAITGAVSEALTNAARHGRSTTATIYAEPGETSTFFVSVKDRGIGFDPDLVQHGEGLARSIRGRIGEIGGTAEISSQPGRGAEVRLQA